MSLASSAQRWTLLFRAGVLGAGLAACAWGHALAEDPVLPAGDQTSNEAAGVPPGPATTITCVALASQEPDVSRTGARAGLLIRELARQAVLLAAREDLRLATRDAVLRETLPAATDASCLSLDLHTSAVPGQSLRINIDRQQGTETVHLIEDEVPLANPIDYRALSKELESWAGRVVTPKLAELTGRATPNDAPPMDTLPESVLVTGSELNEFSQFSAIRQLHQFQHKRGATPDSQAGLARGYAHLTLLTQLHWNVVHKVFAARSLLYAARLVRVTDEESWGRAQRAYCEGLLGLPVADWPELLRDPPDVPAGARTLSEAERQRLRLVQAFSQDDAEGLKPVPNAAGTAPFAALLRFLQIENTQCESLILSTGYSTLEAVPECLRVLDAMSLRNGVINSHRTTTYGPAMLARCVVTRLATIPDLPAAVQECIRRAPPQGHDNLLQGLFDSERTFELAVEERPIWQALLTEGEFPRDLGEPSWQVLGRLQQDIVFLQVARRLDFLAVQLGVPVQPYVPKAVNAIGDYPYASIVKAYGLDYRRDVFGLWKLLRETPVVDGHFYLLPVLQRLHNFRLPDATFLESKWKLVVAHSDSVRWDLENTATLRNDPAAARELLRLFPNSSIAAGSLILYDPGYAQSRQREWEKTFAQDAPVLSALARRYYETGRMRDAERCFRRYVQLSPDEWAYRWLAATYWKMQQPDKWKSTLEEFLTKEDYRLSHATIRNEIAQYHLQRSEWDQALPYAEAAATTGAGWAMLTLAQCYEGLERWEDAEQQVRAVAEHYEGNRCDWYYWCCRTGHGDRKAARRLAEAWTRNIQKKASTPDDWDLLFRMAILGDDPPSARQPAQKSFQTTLSPNMGLYVVLLADEAGDTAQRDETLRNVINRGGRYRDPATNQPRPHTLAFARWMSDMLTQTADAPATDQTDAAQAADEKASDSAPTGPLGDSVEFENTALDINALEKILKDATPEQRTDIEYFAARFCQRHGTPAQVRDYAERAAQPGAPRFAQILARELLRSLEPAAAEP